MDNLRLNHCPSSASMQSNGHHNGGHLRSSLGHNPTLSNTSPGSHSMVNHHHHHHHSLANSLFQANRILSRNSNGTSKLPLHSDFTVKT